MEENIDFDLLYLIHLNSISKIPYDTIIAIMDAKKSQVTRTVTFICRVGSATIGSHTLLRTVLHTTYLQPGFKYIWIYTQPLDISNR